MKGLVLEGGGAKGAFHCGAVKALYDNGYSFDGVAGTSIGAINGALIVQDCGYDSMYEMWTNISPEDISDIDSIEVNKLSNKEFSMESIYYWANIVKNIISNRGVSTEKTMAYLRGIINEEKVRTSPMDYAIATYCLSDRKQLELFKEDIPKGELHNYIMASAYFPAFKMDRLSDKYYFDGGIFNNLPLNVLPERNHNYTEIFAIRTMSRMPHKTFSDNNIKIHYICPSENLGKTVNLGKKFLNRKIKLGYYDALRFIKEYGGVYYYFKEKTDLFQRIFLPTDEFIREQLAEKLNIKKDDSPDNIKKALLNLLKLQDETLDPFLVFFEEMAKIYNVEKFRIYTQQTFLAELMDKTKDEDPQKYKKDKNMLIFNILKPRILEALNGTL